VAPPTDPQALHQAMQALWTDQALHQAMQALWTDLEAASTMGQRARERYLQMFTARQMAQAPFPLESGQS